LTAIVTAHVLVLGRHLCEKMDDFYTVLRCEVPGEAVASWPFTEAKYRDVAVL